MADYIDLGNGWGLVRRSLLKAVADAVRTRVAQGGSGPSGTLSIAENGTYDVSAYASAAVSVPKGVGTLTLSAATPSALRATAAQIETLRGSPWAYDPGDGRTIRFYPAFAALTAAGGTVFPYCGALYIVEESGYEPYLAFYGTGMEDKALLYLTFDQNGTERDLWSVVSPGGWMSEGAALSRTQDPGGLAGAAVELTVFLLLSP